MALRARFATTETPPVASKAEPRPMEAESVSQPFSHCKSVTAYPTRPPHNPEIVIATIARTLAFTEGTEEVCMEINTPDSALVTSANFRL